VVVGFNRQFQAATRAAAAEHFASIGSRHALAKTMYAHAASNLGLVCTFWHEISSLNMDNNKSKPFNGLSGTTLYRKVFF
jgi:hypothetical protein